MIKLTQLIGSQVISIYNGKNEGYISSVIADDNYKKVTALKVIDSETETVKTLNVKDIFSLSDGFILIKNNSKIIVSADPDMDGFSDTIINKLVIDLSGSKKGIVRDCTLDDKFTALTINTDDMEIDVSKVVSIGQGFIVFNSGEDLVRAGRFKPRGEIKTDALTEPENRLVQIQSSPMKLSDTTIPSAKTLATPIKITSNNSYLIGRRVNKDCISGTGELIIRKNSIITARTIQLAKHFNKVKELVTISY